MEYSVLYGSRILVKTYKIFLEFLRSNLARRKSGREEKNLERRRRKRRRRNFMIPRVSIPTAQHVDCHKKCAFSHRVTITHVYGSISIQYCSFSYCLLCM